MTASERATAGQTGWQAVHDEHAIDRDIYTDEAVLEREVASVFSKAWLFVGFESEIPDPGDYVVRPMGRDKVIVTRDEHGGIKALLNTCTHRGTQLCRATFGNVAHFRCSYHGWTFANDGELIGVPHLATHYPRDFDKSCYALRRATVTSYRGFMFATWDEEPPSIEDYLGDFRWYLDAMLDLAGGDWEVYGPPQRVLMHGNWKLVTENFAGDGYHLQTTHQVAFEQGVFANTVAHGILGGGDVDLVGFNVATEGGHTLRAGYIVDKGKRAMDLDVEQPAYIGYPPEVWEKFSANQTPEQIRFNSHADFMHGAVFPNVAFLTVAHDEAIGWEDDPLTKYFVWRVHTPVDARTTECTYWTLVPSVLSEEWKRRSYGYQARSQSAGGLLFEMDDFENFARIDAASAGDRGRKVPFDFTLGLGLGDEDPRFPGPGDAEDIIVTEHNQRAFYRRWFEMMGVQR